MKKFLVFLISIVIVVSFGLVTYYFLRNDEVINFKTNEIYCNVGDIITVNDLGKTVKKESKKTKYNYNAASEDVTAAINYDESNGYYVAQKGGDYEVVISTTNKKFAEFKFIVHIGDGSSANPYTIKDEKSLNKIGNIYALDAHYSLASDILLSNDFASIGSDSESFSGTFNGNNHTITGSSFAWNTENAGLFNSLSNATVKNLTLKSFDITGEYSNAGVLAGSANSVEISNVAVENSTICNTKANGVAGGLIGTVSGSASSITKSSAKNVKLTASDTNLNQVTFGGLVGKLNQSSVRASYATGSIVAANDESVVGGLVGEMTVSSSYGTIQQSYAVVDCSLSSYAGFVNTISSVGDLTGSKYLKYLIGNYSVNGTAPSVKVLPSIFSGKELYKENSVYCVKGFADESELLNNEAFTFYSVEGSKVSWDNYIWKTSTGNLPTIISTTLYPSTVSSEYFLSDIEKQYINTSNEFMEFVNNCRSTDGKIKGKSFALTSDIDLVDFDWNSIDVENSIIDGKGYTIKNLKLKNVNSGNLSFFGTVDNSTIKNIKFENVTFETGAKNAAVVANVVKASDSSVGASSIENITITFSQDISKQYTNFASIANQLNDGSAIKQCTISSLAIASDANINNVAGVVNTIGENSNVQQVDISANIKAQTSVAGIANENNGLISVKDANINITHTNINSTATIAGLVGINNGEISNASLVLSVNVEKTAGDSKIAGAAAINSGSISNVVLTGAGITVSENSPETLYIAGFACTNNGKISFSKCAVDNIGTYRADKRHYVAGIAVENSGNNSVINQVVVSSEISGNTVAGAVIKMNNASAKIEQIAIYGQGYSESAFNQNTIKGDRFVAGVVLDLRNGSVTNVQTCSQIYGTKNSTVSSLITLIFPNGASFKNAAINSSFNGYGKFYSECWQDFRNASEDVKNELDYHTTGNSDRSFDILDYDSSAGSLQSVIINGTTASKYGKSYQSADFVMEGVFFGAYQWPSYENTDSSSFFHIVSEDNFKKVSTYKGSINMSTKSGLFKWGSSSFSKQCSFDFNSVWNETSTGISLKFLTTI